MRISYFKPNILANFLRFSLPLLLRSSQYTATYIAFLHLMFPSRRTQAAFLPTLTTHTMDKTPASGVAEMKSTAESGTNTPVTLRYLTLDMSITHELPQVPDITGFYQRCEEPDLKQYTSPLLWSTSRKAFTTFLTCISTLVTTYTAGAYTAGFDQYKEEWRLDTTTVYAGLTIYSLCFAIAPMVLAPFSEIQGRRPVFVIAGLVYVISLIGSGVTYSFGGMLITRALAGISCSIFSTVASGVLSDIYTAEERNTPMAIFSGAALCGTGMGPMISGIVAQHLSWHWIFYVQTIPCGLVVTALLICFKETRSSVLLSRKAKALNAWYEENEKAAFASSEKQLEIQQTPRLRWKVEADEERANLGVMIKTSLTRPLHLLITESVVFWFSLWMSFAWGVLYMTFAALPLMFKTVYGFNSQQNGLVFTAIVAASSIATLVAIYQDRVAKRFANISIAPEGRLYLPCVQCMLLPVGLFWLGWTCTPSNHWIVPTLAVGCITMGIFSVYLAVSNYLSDVYHVYASSAVAAQSFCRNVFAAVLPLCTRQMFTAMNFQNASSLLGGVGLALTLVPWVLVFYGPRIRARSKIASALADA